MGFLESKAAWLLVVGRYKKWLPTLRRKEERRNSFLCTPECRQRLSYFNAETCFPSFLNTYFVILCLKGWKKDHLLNHITQLLLKTAVLYL